MFVDRGGYSCTVRGSDGPYQGDPFDYLAAYIFQEDTWYIVPAELVVGQGSIALYPQHKGAKYGPYKEAWNLLQAESSRRNGRKRRKKSAASDLEVVDCIHACVEEEWERELWMSWMWKAVSGGALLEHEG